MKRFILFFFFAAVFNTMAQGQNSSALPQVAEEPLFVKVEHPAEFPGGKKAFARYTERMLDQSVPKDMGAPAGVYEVKVEFIVDKEGNISQVKALTDHGYEMEFTAEKLIKKGPKWIPAKQNGHIVRSLRQVAVTFTVK
jgi:periplasmic protein TonB